MEFWEKDFEWLRVRHFVRESLGKDSLPDFQTMLFLIGVQELGRVPKSKFSKEEKRDLMHIAVCTLLEPEGYYEFEGRDQDGWPHWKEVRTFDIKGVKEQEEFLISRIINYFSVHQDFKV
jgi:hypothetical protein